MRPGSPSVLFARVTTSHFAPTAMRSRFDMSLQTAEAISGVRPGETERTRVPVVESSRSHSRNWPTVRSLTAA